MINDNGSNNILGFVGGEVACSVQESLSTGGITVIWSNVQTGDLPPTALSINYCFVKELMVVNDRIVVNDLNSTATIVSDLVAGFVYMLTLTAERSSRSSTIPCGSILLTVGRNTIIMQQILLIDHGFLCHQVYQSDQILVLYSPVLMLEKLHCK